MPGRGGSVALGPLGNMVESGGSAPGFGRLGKDGNGNAWQRGQCCPWSTWKYGRKWRKRPRIWEIRERWQWW
ncbi:hypothetical protein Goklo_000480, partial [Gossypium klotzschianum]|nr:hypothetical protein [Gossypium klotzschianum]